MLRAQESSLDSLSSLLGGLEPEPKKEVVQEAPKAEPLVTAETFSSLEGMLSQEVKASESITKEMASLKEAGVLRRFGSASNDLQSRSVNMAQLQSIGIKKPENMAGGSVEDDLALLVVYVMVASLLAVVGGQVLPGQLAFWIPYLVGASALGLLAIGSTNPGALSVPKDRLARVLNPDYERRMVRHEAAHFLLGYLLGVPVTEYSVETPTGLSPHVEFAEFLPEGDRAKGLVSLQELQVLGPLAMSGLTAEGLEFETVMVARRTFCSCKFS